MLIFREDEKTSDCTNRHVPFTMMWKWQVEMQLLFRSYYLAIVMLSFRKAKPSPVSLHLTIYLEYIYCFTYLAFTVNDDDDDDDQNDY